MQLSWLDHQTGTPLTQVRFRGKGIFFFLPESTFSADSLAVSLHPPCAIPCIFICAHVKDPVVHVRVQWTMETLKHPACTPGWVARLCCSWLSPGKATRIFHGRNPIGTIQLYKKNYLIKDTVPYEVVAFYVRKVVALHFRRSIVTTKPSSMRSSRYISLRSVVMKIFAMTSSHDGLVTSTVATSFRGS